MTRDRTRPEAHWDCWPDGHGRGDKSPTPLVVRVTDLDEGPDDSLSQFISDFTAVNGELYFRADDGGAPVPWKVARDGEVVQAADITFPETLTEFQGELYFYSADSFFRPDVSDGGYGLWKLDRNDDVVFVADVDEGIAQDFPDDLNDKFTVFNGELYIWANLENSGIEPWKVTSDGDLVPVADIDEGPDSSFPREFTEFEDELYFWALDSSGLNDDLWKVARDGDVVRVAESEGGGGSRFSVPSNFGELGGELYFQLDDGESGAEPWKLANDGEPVQVADINAGSASSSPDEFIEFDGELYFRADDGETGVELWKATPDGEVVRVADIDEGPDSSSPGGFTKFDGELYFRADDGETGVELWKVGRDGEVSRVADINDGPASAFSPFLSDFTPLPYDLVPLKDELFFQADDGESGVELWKLDRDGQVVQAADIDPGPDSSFPLALTEFEGEIYFHADDGTTGRELWKVTEGGVKRDRDDQKPPFDDGYADAEGHDEADGEQSRYDDGHDGYLPVHVEAGYAQGEDGSADWDPGGYVDDLTRREDGEWAHDWAGRYGDGDGIA